MGWRCEFWLSRNTEVAHPGSFFMEADDVFSQSQKFDHIDHGDNSTESQTCSTILKTFYFTQLAPSWGPCEWPHKMNKKWSPSPQRSHYTREDVLRSTCIWEPHQTAWELFQSRHAQVCTAKEMKTNSSLVFSCLNFPLIPNWLFALCQF